MKLPFVIILYAIGYQKFKLPKEAKGEQDGLKRETLAKYLFQGKTEAMQVHKYRKGSWVNLKKEKKRKKKGKEKERKETHAKAIGRRIQRKQAPS